MRPPMELFEQDGDRWADAVRSLIEEGLVEWEELPDGSIGYGLTELGVRVCEAGKLGGL